MKLARFELDGVMRIGVVHDAEIVPVSAPQASIRALLEGGKDALAQARRDGDKTKGALKLADVALKAPIHDPPKFLGLGMNFKSHVIEMATARGLPVQMPERQVWFNKQVTCVAGPFDPIHMPRVSDQLDYEGELAIVIGARCRHVPRERAFEAIAGYMVCNDVSVRDWQLAAPTHTLGKSFDTHGPTGPWLTTSDEVPAPEDLPIKTWVDEELRQNGSTNDFVNHIADMIAHLSTVFTLQPGDILTTGTPPGVGAGSNPTKFLKVGQTCTIEIGALGRISNPVILEPEQPTFG